MTSPAFTKALKATGYLLPNGEAAPGLARGGEATSARLRPLLSDTRIGLKADAVFSAQNVPTSIFKDAGSEVPSEKQVSGWHEAAWNVGVAPLLWIITPTDIRLYDCYASPARAGTPAALDIFPLDAADRLRALDAICGRFATETGAFWSTPIGQRIDRRHRVDRELLSEINALEEKLTQVPPAGSSRKPESPTEIKAARDFAQRLIGRCIFASYLIDRGIAQPFLPEGIPANVGEMFASVKSSFALFKWLRSTFNGDLFPMDDPGAEQKRLTEDHLSLLLDFVQGRSLVSGQGRLFRFRYDAIPVDLISSIYQQFARSSAEENARVQGLHYTPVELVHLILDPVFESLPATARIIDPTCGSGAFLVEAFRRLVWKRSEGGSVTRAAIREVLYKQLYGIDINRSALGIAAFSLYLAALELDQEPVTNLADLKFDHLIDQTLFEADTVNDQLPRVLTERPFDAVVGNPPWTFVSGNEGPKRRQEGNEHTSRPRRSPDQEFLKVGARLAGASGRVGMILKASPMFSRDQHAIDSRHALIRELAPVALVNLSALRREELFPDAVAPALLLFARCALASRPDYLLVGSMPWTPDFRRNGIFHVGPNEFRQIPLARVLQTPAMLKAATFGTVRDGWLIERLERSFPSLGQLLDEANLKVRGQGFQVAGGDKNRPPHHFHSLGVVSTRSYTPFRIDSQHLERFEHAMLHRVRDPEIFRGPVLLCPKGNYRSAAEPGRYSASVSFEDVLFNESFLGISFAGHEAAAALALSAVLNSSLTSFQLAFAGSAWGLERPTVEPNDVLSLKVPPLKEFSTERLRAVLEAEHAVAADPHQKNLRRLDEAVFDLYGLERDEAVIVSEGLVRAQMMLHERTERMLMVKPPGDEQIEGYAREVVRTVNAYLRAAGQRHLEAILYPHQLVGATASRGAPGIRAVRFSMTPGAPADTPVVREGSQAEIARLGDLLRGRVNAEVPPYLNERRHLRVYVENDLFVLKPSEARYWTRTAGLNDADIVLADHWISNKHAAVA